MAGGGVSSAKSLVSRNIPVNVAGLKGNTKRAVNKMMKEGDLEQLKNGKLRFTSSEARDKYANKTSPVYNKKKTAKNAAKKTAKKATKKK